MAERQIDGQQSLDGNNDFDKPLITEESNLGKNLISQESNKSLGIKDRRHEKGKYDPLRFPPDLDIVKQHHLANKVGHIQKMDEFCPCCNKHTDKTPIPLSTHREDLGFLTPLIPLYLKYVVYCCIVCLFMFLINLIMIYWNYNGTTCQGEDFKCKESPLVLVSMVNADSL